ncbi:MAG: EamA family transporter [Eubacteriales bacterium]
MIKSLKKNRKGILLMLLSSLCVCFGQLFWKLSTDGSLFFLFTGFVLYAVGALVMIIAYRYGKLSVLQPMLSMNYVLSILIGVFILQELISLKKVIGIVIIVAGVVLIGGSDE